MWRGINLGNMLDARPGMGPSVAADPSYLTLIRDAGFDTVRVPVAWSEHASLLPPFTIAPSLFDAADALIERALELELDIVVDVHHYDELCADPTAQSNRFLALWEQIGGHYAGLPANVHFELLNEPRLQLTGDRWNHLLRDALAVVRRSNPRRDTVIGPVDMNAVGALDQLELPDDDHLITTIHYYEPLSFTHQGAPWLPHASQWSGTRWGSDADRSKVRRDLAAAAAWAGERRRPLFLGEFGTFERAPAADRAAWTECVRKAAEELGIGWCYWELATDFGIYDSGTGTWNEPLRTALLGA